MGGPVNGFLKTSAVSLMEVSCADANRTVSRPGRGRAGSLQRRGGISAAKACCGREFFCPASPAPEAIRKQRYYSSNISMMHAFPRHPRLQSAAFRADLTSSCVRFPSPNLLTLLRHRRRRRRRRCRCKGSSSRSSSSHEKWTHSARRRCGRRCGRCCVGCRNWRWGSCRGAREEARLGRDGRRRLWRDGGRWLADCAGLRYVSYATDVLCVLCMRLLRVRGSCGIEEFTKACVWLLALTAWAAGKGGGANEEGRGGTRTAACRHP